MRYWELPNIFWGAVLGVWVSLILKECVLSPSIYFLPFSLLFLSLLLMVLMFLDRGIETGSVLYHFVTVLFATALTIQTWLFIELMKWMQIAPVRGINLGSIALIILILIVWIFSVETKRYENKITFKEEGWYQ